MSVTSNPEDMEQLRRRFAEFRQTHAVRSRLPEELWAAAAKLARRDGLPATARALDVDQPSLKKWTERFEPQGGQRRTKGQQRRRLWSCYRRRPRNPPVAG